MELKYRARLGSRKVGGRAEIGMRISSADRRIVAPSIVRLCGQKSNVVSPYLDVVNLDLDLLLM